MKRPAAVFFLFFILLASLSRAGVIPEEQLNRGVRNSSACAYHYIAEAGRNKPDATYLLTKAVACAPDLPTAYFALSKTSFSFSAHGLLKSIDYLVQGLNAYSRNFWWFFSLQASLFFSLFLSFVVAVTLVVITRLFRDAPLLTHNISESLRVAVVLPVILLSALAGPLVLIACLLVLLAVYMKKTDRILLYMYLLFLLVSPVLFRTASLFVNAYSSGNFKAIVQVNNSGGNDYALSVLGGDDDYDALFTYALAQKRQGHYEKAIAIYESLIEKRKDPRAYINLGNCYVGLYNFEDDRKAYLEKAESCYKTAIDIKPLASEYYNLSQLSRERLDFTKGNEYYRSALALDRDAVALYSLDSSRRVNRFVADETLSGPDLWKYVRNRHGNGSTFGMSALSAALLPFLALLFLGGFYVLSALLREKAYRCRKCSTVLCAKCEEDLTWGQMCPQCYASLVKLDELDVKERVSRLLAIYDHGRKHRKVMKILSFTLPGLSHIYAGKILPGFFFLWPFVFLVLMPVTQRIFSPGDLTGADFVGWLALLMAAGLWTAAHVITKERISKGWL